MHRSMEIRDGKMHEFQFAVLEGVFLLVRVCVYVLVYFIVYKIKFFSTINGTIGKENHNKSFFTSKFQKTAVSNYQQQQLTNKQTNEKAHTTYWTSKKVWCCCPKHTHTNTHTRILIVQNFFCMMFVSSGFRHQWKVSIYIQFTTHGDTLTMMCFWYWTVRPKSDRKVKRREIEKTWCIPKKWNQFVFLCVWNVSNLRGPQTTRTAAQWLNVINLDNDTKQKPTTKLYCILWIYIEA